MKRTTGTPAAAGAILACLIGAGFASGQEVLQFFTVYGPVQGALGAALASLLLGGASALVLAAPGRDDLFASCCGSLAGRALGAACPALLFGVYVVMLSGAGVLVETGFGLPAWLGRALMLAATLATVLSGQTRMTEILGFAGPLIALFVLAVAAGALLRGPDGRPMSVLPLPPARSWWMAALVYAGYNFYLMAPFLQTMGRRMRPAAGRCAAWVGCCGFGAVLALLHLAFCLSPGALADAAPSISLAGSLWPRAVVLAVPVLLAGVYTTAAPLLLSVWSRLPGIFSASRVALLLTAVAGFAASAFPFGQLVGALYPVIGWFGLVLAAGAAVRRARSPHVRCAPTPPVDKPGPACYDAKNKERTKVTKKDGAST